MVDARLHPADVVAHDEEDVWLLPAVCATAGVLAGPDSDISIVRAKQARRRIACANQASCVAALQ